MPPWFLLSLTRWKVYRGLESTMMKNSNGRARLKDGISRLVSFLVAPVSFAHLKPLPGKMAQELDGNPMLADALAKLGMPKFDTERTSESTRLLDDLGAALDNDISEFNVFIGQVRDAWRAFKPNSYTRFPEKVVVKRGNSPLFAVVPSEDNPVYLPDSSASFIAALEQFSLPVIAIDTSDAKRLAQSFKDSYGDGIQLSSEIEMIPLVNGEKWQKTLGVTLAESEMEWVIALVLTLVAFLGVQAKGTNAKPFLERVRMFREAIICWVPSLEAGLFKGDQKIASPICSSNLDRQMESSSSQRKLQR